MSKCYSYDCMYNLGMLKSFFKGYENGEYYSVRSHASYMTVTTRSGERMYKGYILGRVRLLGSEHIWNARFPDHCNGRDVFFAFILERNYGYRFERGFNPGVAIVCHHFEYGLPYAEDIDDILTLLKVVSWEAFPYNNTYTVIDVADDNTEKLLAMVIAKNDSKPYPPYNWSKLRKTFKAYSKSIRSQLFGNMKTVKLRDYMFNYKTGE